MIWSFYDPDTGELANLHFQGSEKLLELNTPPGFVALPGHADPQSQQVALSLDEDGNTIATLVDWQPPAPADDELRTWAWDPLLRRWQAQSTLLAVQREAADAIDAEAGRARLRYITEVPGQQAVYLRKLEQAQAFVAAAGAGVAPPYIAAEAAATGSTPLEAAEAIMAIASLWDDTISPSIEQQRIGGKRAVNAAGDLAAVQAARDQTLTALASI